MRRPLRQLAFFLTLSLAAGLTACPDGPRREGSTDTLDAVAGDTGDADAPRIPDGLLCLPGDVKSCIQEGGKEALICNASGTAWIRSVCHGEDGSETQCIAGRCTACFPGVKRCASEDEVERCASDGSGWEPYSDCRDEADDQVCEDGRCQTLCELNLKYNSYIGCDYWAVDLDNAFVPGPDGFLDAAGAQYAIVVTNPPDSPRAAKVTIYQKEGGVEEAVPYDSDGLPLPTEALQPGELRVYEMPRRDVNGTTLAPLAYRIVSTVPVVAYQFNPLDNEYVFSNDASLLLPSTLLGREYYVMTREQLHEDLRQYLTVVAIRPGTTKVGVEVTYDTLPGEIYPGSPHQQPLETMAAGESRVFSLQRYDVLNLETLEPGWDPTGTRIIANQRVAVFGGSEASNAPSSGMCVDIDEMTGEGYCSKAPGQTCTWLGDCMAVVNFTCCADHLEQQLLPVKTWGTHYVATKSWNRGVEPDIWRIMASEDGTRVILAPPLVGIQVPTLNAGDWFEFESKEHFEVFALDGKPILLGQFLATQGMTGMAVTARAGDPAFLLTVPIEQFRKDFVFLVPEQYADNYMNVVAEAASEVYLDGTLLEEPEVVGIGEYVVYRLPLVQPGTHTVSSSEPAGLIVYGFDKHVSYGYTGGMDLIELNEEQSLEP